MNRSAKRLSAATLIVLAMTAVIPLAVATGFSNFERPRQLALIGLSAAALIAWGVGAIRQGEVKIASPGILVIGLAFAGFCAISVSWAAVPLAGAPAVMVWLGLMVLFVVLVAPVGRGATFIDWASAVGIGALGAGAMGIYEILGGMALMPVWEPAGATGGFDAMAFATAYYVVALPVLIGAVALAKGRRRWFFAAALVVAAVHLGAVIDGTALVVLLLAMAASAALIAALGSNDDGAGRSTRWSLIGGLVVLAVAAVGLFAPVFDRPTEPTPAIDLPRTLDAEDMETLLSRGGEVQWPYFAPDRTEAPLDHRYRGYLNSVARGLWQQEPLMGHGAGGWWLSQTDVVHEGDAVVAEIFERYPTFRSPHSDYARLLVEQGTLGFALFLLFLAGLATALVAGARGEMTKNEAGRIELWALATALIAGAALMYFVPLLELVSSAVIWFGAAAMAVALASRHEGASRLVRESTVGRSSRWVPYGMALAAAVTAAVVVMPALQFGPSFLTRGHADHLMLRGQMSEAISYYEKAHEQFPAYGEVLYNVALAHSMSGDFMKGEEPIMEALQLRPYDARILSHAALVDLRNHRTASALERSGQAIRTGPNYMEGYDVYTSALYRQGRDSDLDAIFKDMLERELPRERRVKVRMRYGMFLANHLNDPARAKEQFELARQDHPSGPERQHISTSIQEMEMRMERERLEEEGLPIPPALQEEDSHSHSHSHSQGDGSHMPGLHPGNDFEITPEMLERLEQNRQQREQEGAGGGGGHEGHDH